MREAVHDVTQPCAYAKRPWPYDPARPTADSRCRHFDDFGPILVSHARIGKRGPAWPPAGSTRMPVTRATSTLVGPRELEEVGWRCGG